MAHDLNSRTCDDCILVDAIVCRLNCASCPFRAYVIKVSSSFSPQKKLNVEGEGYSSLVGRIGREEVMAKNSERQRKKMKEQSEVVAHTVGPRLMRA